MTANCALTLQHAVFNFHIEWDNLAHEASGWSIPDPLQCRIRWPRVAGRCLAPYNAPPMRADSGRAAVPVAAATWAGGGAKTACWLMALPGQSIDVPWRRTHHCLRGTVYPSRRGAGRWLRQVAFMIRARLIGAMRTFGDRGGGHLIAQQVALKRLMGQGIRERAAGWQ